MTDVMCDARFCIHLDLETALCTKKKVHVHFEWIGERSYPTMECDDFTMECKDYTFEGESND